MNLTIGIIIIGIIAFLSLGTLIPIILVKTFTKTQLTKVHKQEIDDLRLKHIHEIAELNKKIEILSQAIIEDN